MGHVPNINRVAVIAEEQKHCPPQGTLLLSIVPSGRTNRPQSRNEYLVEPAGKLQSILHALRPYLLTALERGVEVRTDVPSILVALATALFVAVSGITIPAIRHAKLPTTALLRSQSVAGSDLRQGRTMGLIIAAQVCLAVVLISGSVILEQSVYDLANESLGLDQTHIISTELDVNAEAYQGTDVLTGFYRPLVEKLATMPDIRASGIINMTPIQDSGMNSDVHIKGQPPYPANTPMLAEIRLITPGYYTVMGTKVIAGRSFDESLDTPQSSAKIIVNQAFADKFFPQGGTVIGSQLDDGSEIIGVVTNVRQNLLKKPLAEMDYLASQLPPDRRNGYMSHMQLVVASRRDVKSTLSEIRRVLHETDAGLPLRDPKTISQIVMDVLTFPRLQTLLTGIFGIMSVVLTGTGLYGLLSQEVVRKKRAIGVQIALGATRMEVATIVFRRAAILVGSGLLIGTCVVLAELSNLRNFTSLPLVLHGSSLLAVCCTFAVVASISSFLPAWRAASTDPMKTLRAE